MDGAKQKYDFHPVCKMFPPMPEEEFDALVEDIRANGLRVSIKTYREKIIDGRHRLRACIVAGAATRFEEWNGEGSLVSYVTSLNLRRRHLTESQRAALAAEIAEALEQEDRDRAAGPAETPAEEPEQPKPAHRPSRSRTVDAAQQAGASVRSTQKARRVKDADPELHERVKAGEVTLTDAEQVVAAADPEKTSAPRGAEVPKPHFSHEDAIALERANLLTQLKMAAPAVRRIPGIDHEAIIELLRNAYRLIEGKPLKKVTKGPVHPQGADVAVLEFPCKGTIPTWKLTQTQVAKWQELFPDLDILRECRGALAWAEANAAKQKTHKGMPVFLVRWLSKAQNDGKGGRGQSAGRDKLSGLKAFVASGGRGIEVSPGVELIGGPHGFDE